ncbi:MAG: hypothetical protein MK212_16080 [Saprospiraceae bacterium]|nr:hypothetical protein [Saprospiraceae bacterium]
MNWIKNKDAAFLLNLGLFLLVLVLSFLIHHEPYLWKNFEDPYDYLRQANRSFLDSELYIPSRVEGHAARPFTVPLLYKLVGVHPDGIILLQKFLNHLAAFILTASLLLYLKTSYLRIATVIFIHALMSWWDVLGWSFLILSESPSMSLCFIWFASYLFYTKNPTRFLLVSHSILLFFFSFTRDNWAYLLLPFYLFMLLLSLWRERQLIKSSLFLFVFMLAIFFFQQETANHGHRYRLPIMNTILVRITPNTDWYAWFEKEGMPQGDELKTLYPNIQPDDKRLFSLYVDQRFKPFFDWVDKHGKSTYTKFLIQHLDYTLLFHETPRQLYRCYANNLWYAGKVRGFSRLFDSVFPIFTWWVLIPVLIGLPILYFRSKELIYVLIFGFLLVFLFHTLVVYNADTFEVERHMYLNNATMQWICFGSITLTLDYFIRKRKEKAHL